MSEVGSWLDFAIAVVITLIVAVIIALIVALVLRGIARRRQWPQSLSRMVRAPFRTMLVVLAVWVAFGLAWPIPAWQSAVSHLLVILTIAVASWFVAAVLAFGLGIAMARLPVDGKDNRIARRRQTQLALIRRLVVAVIVVIGVGAILLTFPAVAALGTSLLASAGIAGIVAGLAAQSTLGSVFAGIQLAFSDAIRVDDVVVVNEQYGRIEEITLTYVVVRIWDDRRLVLPSTYFTSTPFENWTRRSSEILGTVELDLDWRVSPAQMRDALDEILESSGLWDGRSKGLVVTDATEGRVRVRVSVTAADASQLWDLRCLVREELVQWVHEQVAGLPVTRVQLMPESAAEIDPAADLRAAAEGAITRTASEAKP